MARIHISQIEGAGMVSSGLNWYPAIPTIQVIEINPGAVNDITTIALCKQDPTRDLYFKAPVDIYRNGTLFAKVGEYKKTTRLDYANQTQILNEKDTTNPFAVLVYYNYETDSFHFAQGADSATPVIPTLPAKCMVVGVYYEPNQGGDYTQPILPTPVNYFQTTAIGFTTTSSYTLDFKYSQINIYLTGTFTFTINSPSGWTAESDPTGKTLIVRIHVVSGTPTVVWNGSNFKTSDSSITFSTSAAKINVYTIAHFTYVSTNLYQLDNITYTF